MGRLDKNVFQTELAKLQARIEQRFYTTTLTFAQDLCQVIHMGINSQTPMPASDQPRPDQTDVSPTKQSISSEVRSRKTLGKRILKAVQPQLEAALRAEADVSHKMLPTLVQELEGMIDASLEIRPITVPVPRPETVDAAPVDGDNDIAMIDAAEDGEIVVAEARARAENGDRMEVDETAEAGPGEEGNIEVKTSAMGDSIKVNGVNSSTASIDDHADKQDAGTSHNEATTNGVVKTSDTPPADNGYVSIIINPEPSPLTPPQSNGSFSRGPGDVLTDGGLPWYLKGFSLDGTSAVEEQWAGRDAVRSLSEDLTDMDDEELNGLEFDVEDSTITASLADAAEAAQAKEPPKLHRGPGGKFARKPGSRSRKR